MEWEYELVAECGRLTEGPVWDGEALLFSHIPGSRIMRYDSNTGASTEFRTDTNHINGLNFDAQGRLYGCCSGGRSIVRLEPDGATTTLVDRWDGLRFNTPNDLALDSKGRIWFTNPWNEGNIDPSESMEMDHEEAFRADPQPDGTYTVERVTFDTTKTNGILVSPDETILYVAQSDGVAGRTRELRAYPIQADGSLGAYTLLHQFGEDHRGPQRGIDGMCFDSEGNIVATAGINTSGPGPMIYVFEAPSGRVLETHRVPEGINTPTNCAFGGPDLSTLYITSGQGHLLKVSNTGLRGWILWPPSK